MTEQTLQSIAKQWASTEADIVRAAEKERIAQDEVRRLRQHSKTLAEMLIKRVGANIQIRAFDVGPTAVVIVEHERGVRLVETEPKDK